MKRMLAAGVSVLAGVVFSGAAMALDYSADMVSTTQEGSFNGKIYTAGEKIRMEMAGSITITRIDKNVVWVIMPAELMYMEQPFEPEKVAGATEKMPGEIERALLGREALDGGVTD